MLTEYICMDICLCYLEMLRNTATKTCCIQQCTGTDYLFLRNTGDLGKYISHNIYRIAYDNVNSIWSFLCDLWSNVFHNIYIRLCKLDPGLSRLSGNPGCNNYNVRVPSIFIFSCDHGNRTSKTGTLKDIHHFTFYLFLVNINHNDFRRNRLTCQSISDGRTYATCTNNSNFATHNLFLPSSSRLFFNNYLNKKTEPQLSSSALPIFSFKYRHIPSSPHK